MHYKSNSNLDLSSEAAILSPGLSVPNMTQAGREVEEEKTLEVLPEEQQVHPDLVPGDRRFFRGNLSRKPSFLERARESLLNRGQSGNGNVVAREDSGGAEAGWREAAGPATARMKPAAKSSGRRVSRRTSFLESKPMRKLSRLTRR